MKIRTAFLAALALACVASAKAQEFQSAQEFARGVYAAASTDARMSTSVHTGAPMRLSGAVPDQIASAAARTVGAHWTPTLIRIARIESGLRCSPGGNGGGLFQFIRGTRRSLGLMNPRSCAANIAAAMRYAARCIAQGARTAGQMGACWNSGSPFTARRHLERAYRVARL